jgi:hypothetical protein
MSLFTPAVFVILAIAALCALLASRLRSRLSKNVILLMATSVLALATWLAASDAWAFRDGFPVIAPGFVYPETHGLAAVRMFLRSFWVPLIGIAAVAALIATIWRRRLDLRA